MHLGVVEHCPHHISASPLHLVLAWPDGDWKVAVWHRPDIGCFTATSVLPLCISPMHLPMHLTGLSLSRLA